MADLLTILLDALLPGYLLGCSKKLWNCRISDLLERSCHFSCTTRTSLPSVIDTANLTKSAELVFQIWSHQDAAGWWSWLRTSWKAILAHGPACMAPAGIPQGPATKQHLKWNRRHSRDRICIKTVTMCQTWLRCEFWGFFRIWLEKRKAQRLSFNYPIQFDSNRALSKSEKLRNPRYLVPLLLELASFSVR